MRPRVSVIVPTRGRPAMLERCLNALERQDLDRQQFEVIVADDGASEETRRLIEQRAGRGVNLRYVRTAGGRGPAVARNLGIRVARGEILAFTDDDCVPDPTWLRAGLAAFVDGVVGVSGQTVVPLRMVPTDYECSAARLADSEFVTANCFYRRKVVAAVGGFDERFKLPWREDTDLYFTLLARNGQLIRTPEARVVHEVRPSVWGISVRQQRKSEFNALLYKKHPELYRHRIQSQPPWRYYAIDLSLLAALTGVLANRRRTWTLCAALWVALTGHFCLERLRHTSKHPSHIAEMLITSILIPPLATFWRLRGAVRFRVPFL